MRREEKESFISPLNAFAQNLNEIPPKLIAILHHILTIFLIIIINLNIVAVPTIAAAAAQRYLRRS